MSTSCSLLHLSLDASEQFSADLLCVDVGHGGAGSVKSVVGNALAHVLVRPGGVVMRLVSGQDSAQMSLAEDQHAVEEFAAQDADEAFADRVHARRLDSGPQDPAASCLENGVEGGAAPDRRRRHAGSPTRWTALPARRAWSVRRGCGGIPTADSPSPGERQGGRCPGPSAGGRAGAACSCRTCPRPACGARPAASLASRGRSRSSARGICAVPARRTTPGRLAYTGPGRRAGVAPRSRAEQQQLSILREVPAEYQDSQAEYPANEPADDLEQHPASQPRAVALGDRGWLETGWMNAVCGDRSLLASGFRRR